MRTLQAFIISEHSVHVEWCFCSGTKRLRQHWQSCQWLPLLSDSVGPCFHGAGSAPSWLALYTLSMLFNLNLWISCLVNCIRLTFAGRSVIADIMLRSAYG